LKISEQEIELSNLQIEQQIEASKLQIEQQVLVSNLQDEKQRIEAEKRETEADISTLTLEIKELSSAPLELEEEEKASETGLVQLQSEHQLTSSKLQDALLQMESENSWLKSELMRMSKLLHDKQPTETILRCELQRMSSADQVTMDAHAIARVPHDVSASALPAVVDGCAAATNDRVIELDIFHVTPTVLILQAVTRGHHGRRLFQLRCSEVALQLLNEAQQVEPSQEINDGADTDIAQEDISSA
jgi:hypothetical protein